MIPVILESPYAGETKENLEYLQRCIRDSIERNEAPFASHQMYTQALDDNKPEEREAGIDAGYIWMRYARIVAFYIDYGMSKGMHDALDIAINTGKQVDFRTIRGN